MNTAQINELITALRDLCAAYRISSPDAPDHAVYKNAKRILKQVTQPVPTPGKPR